MRMRAFTSCPAQTAGFIRSAGKMPAARWPAMCSHKRRALMSGKEWETVTKQRLMWFTIGAGLFFVLLLKSERGFVFIVDHANLLFHEAGHVFIGFFSQRLETYGGTIGQLVFPVALAVSFWRKNQPLPVAAAMIWFFENWLNIARYMADARALQLPLVGGGDHDWNTILNRWDLLIYDTRIAAAVTAVGWIGMVAAYTWVWWRGYADHHRAPEMARWAKF